MRAPEYWYSDNAIAHALVPLTYLWRIAVAVRRRLWQGSRVAIPVVCVGNLVVGGAGKTPLAIAVARHLAAHGKKPHFLTRGYGGRTRGPLRVDPAVHDARDVGDEPLLLARVAPTWVAHNRLKGAIAAMAAGADIIVMDDGFQNPSLAKDLSILAVDGGYGFGNALVLPAGPLREPLIPGVKRADAVVVIGTDARGSRNRVRRFCEVYEAHLLPRPNPEVSGKRVIAFAGIGRPAKFYATLRQMGCTVVDAHDFADHHRYRPEEIMRICDQAAAQNAVPVTTEKDYVRLPAEARAMVQCVVVDIEWANPAMPERLLAPVLQDRDG